MAEYVRVARLQELPPGRMKHIPLSGGAVALHNVNGQIYATQDACPHEGVSLSKGGHLDGETLTCGYHFWCFNVRSGEPEDGLGDALTTYVVKVQGDDIYLLLETGRSPRMMV